MRHQVGSMMNPLGMNLPIVAGNQSGVQALQSQLNGLNLNTNSHTPPTLTDEDFPSLLG